jgi:hypothetical protein
MERPTDISQEEAGQMIANLVYRNEYPPPDRLQLLLVQYRDFKRRWDMFAWCFPWLERFMIWLSRRRGTPS